MEYMVRRIRIAEYDPEWPAAFDRLRSRIEPALKGMAHRIEHIGSTAVPGLAAKPIIDLDVIVPAAEHAAGAITRLAKLGYVHEGDLGVPGREAFRAPDVHPKHHLYLCVEGSAALANHLRVRDALRADPVLAREYVRLKLRLAHQSGSDMSQYTLGKAAFLNSILRMSVSSDSTDGTLIAP
jgi:GrpB-like predicted nucleotidyltransferase (UPF0157 family)